MTDAADSNKYRQAANDGNIEINVRPTANFTRSSHDVRSVGSDRTCTPQKSTKTLPLVIFLRWHRIHLYVGEMRIGDTSPRNRHSRRASRIRQVDFSGRIYRRYCWSFAKLHRRKQKPLDPEHCFHYSWPLRFWLQPVVVIDKAHNHP